MTLTPDLRAALPTAPLLPAGVVEAHLGQHGHRRALVADGVSVTHAELGRRVAEVARSYAGARRLVLLSPGNDVDSVVEYLGALAADQVVLLCGEQARAALTSSYDPDVVVAAGERRRLREGSAHELHPDLSLLLSTSGSTGSPKLVRLSRDGLLANAHAIGASLGIRPDDLADLSLPLHYCYGLSVLHSHLLAGAAVRLTGASVLDEAFWEGAEELTSLSGVPHTFDLLERSAFADRELPGLRYLTQAGGRMPAERVRAWAGLGRERGWDFVVMYGQTEATARLTVLPPDRALDAPDAIGLPVDGVELSLTPVDEAGGPGDHGAYDAGVGELVVRGPGVMLGYAESPGDLGLGRTVDALHTGDLARLRPDGLWQVVGRRSRFAKVCGLRVDLDHLERTLAAQGYVVAAADAGDRVVLGVATGARTVDAAALHAAGLRACTLAPSAMQVVALPELPHTERGKVDRAELVRLATAPPRIERAPGSPASAEEVTALYARLLGRPDARPTDSFVGLGGDSLSYVEVSLRLEALLGDLPADWPSLPAAALADVPRRPVRAGTRLETSVLLRALAILTVVGSHANAVTLLGGAHVLLAVVGFNLARFQLTDAPRLERARRILTTAARVAVPAVLVIGVSSVVGLWAEGITWRQVLLVNGLTSASWSEPGWYFWFIEALVHTLVLLALFLAVPRVDAWERARPFGFPMALVGLAMLSRYDVVNVPGDAEHRAHVVFWIVALGWAAARARTHRQRVLVSVVAVITMIGAFAQWERDLYVAIGLLALVWVPHVRVPRVLARAAGVLAAASLWIYLTHWQVYPRWEESHPWLALGASVAVGVACAGIAGALGRLRPR